MKTILLLTLAISGYQCSSIIKKQAEYSIPAEFDRQEYIWLSWKENGFFGGAPFKTTIVDAIEAIHREVNVKLLYGPQMGMDKQQVEQKIWSDLLDRKIDTSRISLFYNEKSFGAIQDPGPIFLIGKDHQLAVADFRYMHPDKRSEAIDRNVARDMDLPIISSEMVSEGGA